VSRLLRSEWRKVTTTKLWWGMLLGAMALAALGVAGQIGSNGSRGNPAAPLSTAVTQKAIAASAAGGFLFSVVLGIILLTTEFRHFTSRPTFLLEPRRGRVVLAKMLVAGVVGLGYGIACAATAAAIMVPWLGAKGITIGWTANGVVESLVSGVLVVTIYAVVGIGIGVLLRNQIVAVIGALAYLFVVEPLISIIPVVKEIYRFLPGAAANALTGGGRSSATLLSAWQGGLLLLGWGVFFTALGLLLTIRRDIP
jgi:ABC-2 type transport system permease protein